MDARRRALAIDLRLTRSGGRRNSALRERGRVRQIELAARVARDDLQVAAEIARLHPARRGGVLGRATRERRLERLLLATCERVAQGRPHLLPQRRGAGLVLALG